MLINLQNASDVVKLLDIVNVFMTVRDSHKAELEAYIDKIDELETKLDDLQARHNHLAEQKREHRQEKAEAQKVIDDLREELRLIIEKNTQLQRTVDQLNAENELLQASIDRSTQEKARLEGIIGKQEGEYQELISHFNKVRDDRDYTKLISTKLCEVVKRHYPSFTYERFCASFEKETKRIKKLNEKAEKHKKNWNNHVKRTDQQSS